MNQTLKTFLTFLAGSAALALIVWNSNNSANVPNAVVVSAPLLTNETSILSNQTLNSTVKVTQLSLKKDRVILLEDEINAWTVNAAIQKLNTLNKTSGEIYLLLDSPGGSVFDGAKLISAMEASKNKVTTVCVGLCASMAAVIHQYGYRRLAHNRSQLMFHPAAGGLRGPVPGMTSLLNFLNRYLDKTDTQIIARSKISAEKYHDLVNKDLWIDAEDAMKMGFVDELVATDYEHTIAAPQFGEKVTPGAVRARKVGTVEFEF